MRFLQIVYIFLITFTLIVLSSYPIFAASNTHAKMPSTEATRAIQNYLVQRPHVFGVTTQNQRIKLTPTIIRHQVVVQTRNVAATNTSPSIQDFLISAINSYRASAGLSAVKVDSNTCAFAKMRAREIATAFSHDGFSSRVNNKTLPYPSYSEITENIAMNSNYQDVVNAWINSPGHAANMRKDTPYVCVEKIGDYYAYEGWRP